MKEKISLSDWFWSNLAELLSEKIISVYPDFNFVDFIKSVELEYKGKTLKERISLIAEKLNKFLKLDYPSSINIFMKIMGEENPNETWMFTNFYWLMPIWKFIEIYGIDYFDISIDAISELTKRNTGEYTVRPFINKYPEKMILVMKNWAKSDNFHLRCLASEWLRPKLPWAKKLDIFIDNPKDVFDILEILKNDDRKFVMKSVANNIADYLKLNPLPALSLLESWEFNASDSTKWIIKCAKRKYIS